MSTAPAIITSNFGARIGRKYTDVKQLAALSTHARLQSNDSLARLNGLIGTKDPSRTQALDYFSNPAARMGWATPSLTESTEYELVRLSYNYWLMITLYRNHWISRKIVDVPAHDMVRAWPRLTSDIEPKDLTRIDKAIRKTQTKSKIQKTLEWARLFGGAGALIVIEGQEKNLDEPLDLESIDIGSYRGLIPFDRWAGIYPEDAICGDVRKPKQFNLPEHYRVQTPEVSQSFRVHASRILRFCGPSVPTPEYQAQQYWGISVLEPAFEEIRKRDNLSWNLIMLSFRASILSLKEPELAQILSGVSVNMQSTMRYQQRMEAFNQLLSNQSLVVVGKDGGLESTQQNISGWPDMYQQFQLDIAGAADIPVTQLFGRTLTGLGQSNDADQRIYEKKIASDQEDQMRPQLETLFSVIAMSELGEVPDDLDLIFPSLRVLDDKEKVDLAKVVVDNVGSMFDRGLFTEEMALMEIKQSSDVTGFGTNITDEQIEAAKQNDADRKELKEAQQEQLLAGPEEGEASAGSGEGENESPNKKTPKSSFRAARDSAAFLDIEFSGIPVTIEVMAGDTRTIRNEAGEVVYKRKLQYDYGFIRGTIGRDDDETDVILGPAEYAPFVYVADMIDLGPDVDKREN